MELWPDISLPRRLILLIAIVCCTVSLVVAQCPHEQAGLTAFSSVPEWNTANAVVTIASNQKILLDAAPQNKIRSIDVSGELVFANTDLSLHLDWLKVSPGGKLRIGSSTCPITKKITLVFYGPRSSAGTNPMGRDPSPMNDALGEKGIAVASGGSIEIFGEVQSKTWVRLTQTARAGAATLHIDSAVNWKRGDRIIITSTDFGPLENWNAVVPESISWVRGSRKFPEQTEERFLALDAANSRTIQLDQPLNYTHWGEGYERAEIGLLTRNIVIRGDDASADENFGAHLILRNVVKGQLQGIEFYNVGQQGVVGRYPVHFHMMHDQIGKNIFVHSCAIHRSFQRCVAIHDSNGIAVRDNVAYMIHGHCYFLEDGGERMNVFERNLGAVMVPISKESGRQIIPTDNEVSVFWITNPNNTFVDNVAVGGKFGYWFVMPVHPTGFSVDHYEKPDPWVRPRWTPLGRFDRNVAHGCIDTGVEIDEMSKADGTTELASYEPKKGPFAPTVANWELESVDAVIDGIIAYKNREYGIWSRGGPLRYKNLVLLDNKHGMNCVPGPCIVENSHIIGETDNVGTPNHADNNGRSRPDKWSSFALIKGFENYDNGGPQYLRNVTFEAFEHMPNGMNRPAGALGGLNNGPFKHDTRNRYMDLKFINANRVYIIDGPGDNNQGINVMDVDGSITGFASGGWIVSNNSFMIEPACRPEPTWNAYACPMFAEGYAQLLVQTPRFSDATLNNPSNKLHRIGFVAFGGQKSEWNYGGYSSSRFTFAANVPPRRGYALRVADNLPTPNELTVALDSSIHGEWAVIAIPYPQSALPFVVESSIWSGTPTSLSRVMQLNLLTPTTYYYDTQSEHLFLLLANSAGLQSFNTRWGFTDYNYDGRSVRVRANCVTCTCNKFAAPAASLLDSISGIKEDQYKADLSKCGEKTSTSTANGVAFFHMDTVRRQLHVNINHPLTATASEVTLHQLINTGAYFAANSSRVIPAVTTPASPVRTVVDLSHDEWVALVRGHLFVKVATKEHPAGEIRGHLLCNNVLANGKACALPPAIPTPPKCSPARDAASFTVYNETQIIGWPEWDLWTWNPESDPVPSSADGRNQEMVLCGTYSLKVTLQRGEVQLAHHVSTRVPNPTVDVSRYKHFQFYVRAAPNNGTVRLRMSFYNTQGRMSQINIASHHIDRFKIDDQAWSRVRISATEMGAIPDHTGYANVQRYLFNLQSDSNSEPKTFYVDNMQWVTDATVNSEPMTSLVTSNDVRSYDPNFCEENIENTDGRLDGAASAVFATSSLLLVAVVQLLLVLVL